MALANKKTLITDSLIYAGKTDIGKVREINEDNYLIEVWPDGEALLAVVADGMGKNAAGEVAAKIAIDTFRELINHPLPSEDSERCELLMERFYAANTNILQTASSDFNLLGMGTTVVAAIITPTNFLHLYAGDSRLYHFRKGELPYVTVDHSVVQMLLELGRITPEQIATHPMRSVINSCLGGQGNSQFSIDPKWDENFAVLRQLRPGNIVLMCSDGLHGFISPEDLQNLVEQFGESPEQLSQACINLANQRGGEDNITVIAIRVKSDPKPMEEAKASEPRNIWRIIMDCFSSLFF